MRPVVNWRAYELSRRAGATQPQPNVPCGNAGPVLLEPPFSRKIRVLVFFFFFLISNLFLIQYWPQYIKTPWGPKKTHLVAGGGFP